ncbi:MAG: OmpA family protein [Deltaproteobacteria bacterium]|nr:OmpA family protein [Deltaproteobacteria bacterium]
MSKKDAPIIIKKIKKAGHGGHHGGAWKVAYADFVTAMMAFFLVMWLIATLSIEGKKNVGQYFRSYTIFKGTEAGGGQGISVLQGTPVNVNKEAGDMKIGDVVRNKLVTDLGKIIEQRLDELKKQILVINADEGVRVELVEKTGSPIFELGRATLLPNGNEALKVLAEGLNSVPNDITIEGHTDSYQYPREDYTNWELAADRANAARRALIKNGLDPERIKKVTSFADVVPISANNAYDPINRRVSILVEMK